MKIFMVFIMFLVSAFSYADEEKVFLENVSINCLSAIEHAFINRKWNILSKSESSISATISGKGRGVTAEISIFYREGGFFYTGRGIKQVKNVTGPNQFTKKNVYTKIPQTWIVNLKRDTIGSGEANCRPEAISGEEKVRNRLEKLKKLHEDGLISDEEYQELRMGLLKSI